MLSYKDLMFNILKGYLIKFNFFKSKILNLLNIALKNNDLTIFIKYATSAAFSVYIQLFIIHLIQIFTNTRCIFLLALYITFYNKLVFFHYE